MRISNIILATVIISLSSCRYFGGERVYGDGHIVTQQRNTGSFEKVDVSGGIKVHVRQESFAIGKAGTGPKPDGIY